MVAGIPEKFRRQARVDVVVEHTGSHARENALVAGCEKANVEGHWRLRDDGRGAAGAATNEGNVSRASIVKRGGSRNQSRGIARELRPARRDVSGRRAG